jgi:multicomponent Na+:H+ antiporter subunit D
MIVILLVLLSSFLPGIIIAALREEQVVARTVLNLAGAVAKLGLVGVMLWGITRGQSYELRFQVLPELELSLVADPLALLFITLSAVLWLVTTIYAIGYLEGAPNRSRFFAFFSLCVTATVGIALAGDLFTFIIFYEALTWTTYPLVVHRGTPAATRAGRIYLLYTVGGGTVLLVGIIWLHAVAGTVAFADGGVLGHLDPGQHPALIPIFALLVIGLGVKAALVPLHGWLPEAMVAPAPVSALLHAVAVVKAGAYGIVRVLHSVYGIDLAVDLGVAQPLMMAAGITIIYGSVRALAQDDLKKRLAFSTVSQVSYIALGAATLSPLAAAGGIVHLVHQGLMKITLFFCAGILAETVGVKKVSEMAGVGRRMPWTMGAFTICALGMIGVPPMAGFISKWYLGLGGIQAGMPWVVLVLVASTLLNAGYFLPILGTAWFGRAPADSEGEAPQAPVGPGAPDAHPPGRRHEASLALLVPTVVTAALALAAGLFAHAPVSPLGWTVLIVGRLGL